jgi:sugar transferase (PEP-CTERM/EpsH1 system associated)
MRILFIVPYTPNLIRARSYNLIRSLSINGHKIILGTLWSSKQEQESGSDIQQYCEAVYSYPLPVWKSLLNCLAVLPTSQPLQSAYCWQNQLAGKVSKLLNGSVNGKKIDIVHVEHLRGVRYGLHIQSHKGNTGQPDKTGPPIVWDSVDNISYLFRQSSVKSQRKIFRWLTTLELSRTEKYEAWLLDQFSNVLVTSKKDRDAFLTLDPDKQRDAKITILTNGVDLSYFKPHKETTREINTLVVSGKMSYHANISMVSYLVKEIMPKVWQQRADTKLWIVGKDPTDNILALGNNPNIVVTGTVDDIRPYLQKATIAVVPLTYGAGIQFKLLESMACGTPVVASKIAVSSLNTVDGQDVLVADNTDDFAKHIIHLSEDTKLRENLGLAGRQYVEKNHNWTDLAAKLEGVYHNAIITRN